MNDKQIIQAAVELADGWSLVHIYDGEDWGQEFGDNSGVPTQQVLIQDPHKFQSSLDALAAQLVRQVDALDRGAFHCEPTRGIVCEVTKHYPFSHKTTEVAEGPDRTMNTLRAIVESGVLSNG